MANNEIQKNKDNMLSMIAIIEDITRTTSRLHDVLYNLMSNPRDIKDIKNSINDLYDKVNTLKGINVGSPLIEEEKAIVPGPNDVSPEKDPNYKSRVNTVAAAVAATPPESENVQPQNPRRNLTTTPRKVKKPPQKKKRVMRNSKGKLPSPDINSI